MSNPTANHLRLHIEDPWGPSDSTLDLPAWRLLRDAYQGLTGWQIDCTSESLPLRAEPLARLAELYGTQPGLFYVQRGETAQADATQVAHANDLARAIGGLLSALQQTRQALRHREAELATAVPVIARTVADTSEFDHRLQAILRGTVESLQGQAAALYLLDDATTELKLRAHWGLSSSRFLDTARPLRGAIADLEALTGHAVVLEDTQLFGHWNVPETFASAVCVPVSSPDALLGTFWFFAKESRDYTDGETQLLEMIAGRLAVELERRVLLSEAAQSRESREQAAHISTWHDERSRPAPPVVSGWQVAGTTVIGGRPRGDFHLWRLDDDDQLWLATAAVAGVPTKSILTSTLLQGALRTSLRHPTSPEDILRQLHEVLWTTSAGGEAASLFCGSLDPATGKLCFDTAGATDAYILRPHGWEPIVEDPAPLGLSEEWCGTPDELEIHRGDILLVISSRDLTRGEPPVGVGTTALAEALLHHVHLSAKDLAGLASHLITKQCPDPWARSILVAKRTEAAN